jgi:hypothetical protein
MMRKFFAFLLLFLSFNSQAQTRVGSLPEELSELSGLVFINDSILVGHNDSGHEPVLYFISVTGTLLHSCTISDAENKDWEDIAYDGDKFLYIGDVGNNENKRKELAVYKVSLTKAMLETSTTSEKIEFRYPDQTSFPPIPSEFRFDAEAMTFYNDSLYIFTKCRTEPWDGKTHVYSLSTKIEKQSAHHLSEMFIGSSGWWKDAVTGIDIHGDYCYMLTYNRLIIYKIKKGKMSFDRRIYLKPITQKESIAVNSKGEMYVGDERSKLLGGGFLYKIEETKK